MGVIYELLSLPKTQRKKLAEEIAHQEAAEKLKSYKIEHSKIKSSK